jgi:hypothetical protein
MAFLGMRKNMAENGLEIRTARLDELPALTTLMTLAIGELLKP